jgi:uncharacterized membrane protein YeiH
MFDLLVLVLEWIGLCAFVMTGAIVAARRNMDVIGFVLLGTVTGIGGGTTRDVILGRFPVSWVAEPSYLVGCIVVSIAGFFVVPLLGQARLLLWLDAVGLALFAVSGAHSAQVAGASPMIAITMGVVTATFGGMIRDVLSGASPVVLSKEIYVTAALAGSATYVGLGEAGVPGTMALVAGFAVAMVLRSLALYFELSLPRYPAGKTGNGS